VGVKYLGEEHRYYTKANRYEALFWGGAEPVRFDVISVKHLKEAKQAVQSFEWKLPSPALKLTS
jgi:hypothetical protein